MKYFLLITVLCLGVSTAYAESAGEYLYDGNDALSRGDTVQAIFNYSRAIEINPNMAKAYDNRGVAYAKQGFMSPAIADFTMAIAANPKDAEAYNNRGHAYASQIKLPQAIQDYSRAIRLNPVYIKAYNNRAQAYYYSKQYDKAWADVFKIKELGGQVDGDFYRKLTKASK